MTTWLLLEDEPDLFEMVLTMVGMLGIGGEGFCTGSEALDWIETVDKGDHKGEVPELALLDIRMPDHVPGTQVAARIRQSPVLKDMIIVLMTAYRLSAQEEKAMMEKAGANLLFYKPLPKFDELTLILKGLVAGRIRQGVLPRRSTRRTRQAVTRR